MIRTAYIFLWVVIATTVLGIIAITISLFARTGNAVHIIARIWAKSILMVSRIKVKIYGLSNINLSGSYIYMSNHQSSYDIPVLLAHLPVQFRWLAKAELFKIPIFGRSMRGAGYIGIDRFNQISAFKTIDDAARKIKAGGISIMIFPEGTRSLDGNLRPFKKGGFVMAVEAQVPVVPVILQGTRAILPKGSLRVTPGVVHMKIEDPIDTSRYNRDTKDELMERVRDVIRKGSKQATLEGVSK
jgi:1-acyl-sn-glycerol-3-phosphate acyltransferase